MGSFKPFSWVYSWRFFLLWPWVFHITRLGGSSRCKEQTPAGTCPGRTSMGRAHGSHQHFSQTSILSSAVVQLLGRVSDISCFLSTAALGARPPAHTQPQLQGRMEEILLIHHFLPVYSTLLVPWPTCYPPTGKLHKPGQTKPSILQLSWCMVMTVL